MTDMNDPEGQTLNVHDIDRQKQKYFIDNITYFPSRGTCTFPTDGYASVPSDEAITYSRNLSLSLPQYSIITSQITSQHLHHRPSLCHTNPYDHLPITMSRRRPNRHLRERSSAHSIFVKQITEVQLTSQSDVPQLNTTSATAGVVLSDLRCRFVAGGAADNSHALIRLATAIDGADDNLGALDSVGRQALLVQRDAQHGDLMREDANRWARFVLEQEGPGYDESQDEDEDNYFYEEDEEGDGIAGLEDDQDADNEGEDSAVSDLTPTSASPATLAALTQSDTHLNIPREMLFELRPPPGEFRLDGQEAGQENGLEDEYKDEQ
jgi:hypothetical protein